MDDGRASDRPLERAGPNARRQAERRERWPLNAFALAIVFCTNVFIVALCALSVAPALGQDVWRTKDGRPAPETPARKAKNGLGVWLVVTSDADWQEKWATPSHEIPNFAEVKTISTGGRLAILTFVVNPRPDATNSLNVVSHIKVTRPNGTISVDSPGLRCLRGSLQGPATNVRLCEAVIQFSADPGDPVGTWKIEVRVKDVNRNTEIPVEASFELKR